MQETLKKVIGNNAELKGKTVTICIKAQCTELEGFWQWDMQSDAVYCSDMMLFPEAFEGTIGIIHPDDIKHVGSALELLADKENLRLEFRIITTYGEVKTISGHRIAISTSQADKEPEKAPWAEATSHLALRKEADHLQHQKELADAVEKLQNAGTWFINKNTGYVYYSNNIYRIHGLQPQSLNAHAHTFHAFIYPDDKAIVTDAIEQAYKEELPLHISYRIVKQNGDICRMQLVTLWSYNKKANIYLMACCRILPNSKHYKIIPQN